MGAPSERRPPLAGRRVAVTRAREQAGDLIAELAALGADAVACPAIAFAPPESYAALDAAVGRLASYDWLVVTSANGARALLGRMEALGLTAEELRGVRVAAVGPGTASALAAGGVRAGLVPAEHVAEGLLAALGEVAGARVLLPQADIAREALAEGLRARGAAVDEVAAYRTVPGEGGRLLAPLLRAGAIDAVTFTSGSTVRYLLDGLERAGMPRGEARDRLSAAAAVCIGPVTAAAARAEGILVAAEAAEHTGAGVVRALVELLGPPAAKASTATKGELSS